MFIWRASILIIKIERLYILYYYVYDNIILIKYSNYNMIDSINFKELNENINHTITPNSINTSFTLNSKNHTYDYCFLLDELNQINESNEEEINDSYILDIKDFAENENDNEIEDIVLENTPFTEIYIHDLPDLKRIMYLNKNLKTKYIFIDKISLINVEELYIGYDNINNDNVKQIISLILDSCEINKQMESDINNIITCVVCDCGCHNLNSIHIHNTTNTFVFSCDCEEVDYSNLMNFYREKVFSLIDPTCRIAGILFYRIPISFGITNKYIDKSHLGITNFTTKFFNNNFVKCALLTYIHDCLTKEERFNLVNIMLESVIKPNEYNDSNGSKDYELNLLNCYDQYNSLLKILSDEDISYLDIFNMNLTIELINEKYNLLGEEIKKRIIIDDGIINNNDIDDDDIIEIDFED